MLSSLNKDIIIIIMKQKVIVCLQLFSFEWEQNH